MNFRDEYKFAAEELTPDKETVERIKAGVHRRINGEKRPLNLKKIAYFGGALAACAMVTITAVNVLPKLNIRPETAAPNTIIANDSRQESAADAPENELAYDTCNELTISEEVSDIPNNITDSGFGHMDKEANISDAEEDTVGSNVIAPQVPGITTDTPKVPDLPQESTPEPNAPAEPQEPTIPEDVDVDEVENDEPFDPEEPQEGYNPYSDIGPFTEDDYFPNGFRFFEGESKIALRSEENISVLLLQSDAVLPDDIGEWLSLPITERSSGMTFLFYYHPTINGLIWVADAETKDFVGLYIVEE
ncbi:MAG: hypothetical protein ACI4J8_02565 [Oscillospiraceae bacterium]